MSVQWQPPRPDEIVRAYGAEANDNHGLDTCSQRGKASALAAILMGGAIWALVLWAWLA